MDAQELRNLREAYMEVVENQQFDEELTGDRLERAKEKIKSLGRRKSTLASREALSRVSIGKEGTGVQGGRKAPVKRGGGGTKGQAKVSGSGGDDMDRGYGNKSAKRSGTYREAMWESDEVVANEGYKKLPSDKMARQAFKKNLKATKDSIKTRFTTAPQSTARNVDVAKANKKLSQAKKIMDVRDKTHVPSEVKSKEAKNRKTDYLSLVKDKYSEQVDLYDIILSHLLDEGYADTLEAAEAIMVNMSEEWRQSIVG